MYDCKPIGYGINVQVSFLLKMKRVKFWYVHQILQCLIVDHFELFYEDETWADFVLAEFVEFFTDTCLHVVLKKK